MSSTDRTKTVFKYAGWIPTVAGRLSFRHIGESRHPTESEYANVTTDSSRLILAFQSRPLSDALFSLITDFFTRHSGDFWFALRAENSRSSSGPGADGDIVSQTVNGTIYIFKSSKDWREKAQSAIQPTIEKLNELRLSLDDNRDTEIAQFYNRSESVLQGTADIAVKFALKRKGEVYFSQPKFLDPDLESASLEFASTQKQDFSKWVADQSYFFLRDLCHQHQHHDMSEDTILILRPLDSKDIKWRREVIFSLYFRIIRAKRSSGYPYRVRALGILAYCRSFKRISLPIFRSTGTPLPDYSDAALRDSIRAKIEEDATLRRMSETAAINRATTSANVRMLVLTVVLIFLAVMGIFGTEITEYPPNHALALRLAPMLVPTLEIIGLSVIFTLVLTSQRVLGWKSVLEISNVYRRATMLAYLAIALIFMGFTVYLCWGPINLLWDGITKPYSPPAVVKAAPKAPKPPNAAR